MVYPQGNHGAPTGEPWCTHRGTMAPFSVPLGRMEAVQGLRKARFERETWTYFALLYLHNGISKNQRSAEINSDRTPLLAYRF